jgi:ABC-type amino acid transport substrate-binding protein
VVENSDVQSFILYNKKAAIRKMSAYWQLYPDLASAVSALRNGDISAVMGRTQLLQYHAQSPPCVLDVVDLPIAIDFWAFVLPRVRDCLPLFHSYCHSACKSFLFVYVAAYGV